MRPAQLQYFITVCEDGTITKAAERLHISQPSITKAIQELEEEFGIQLFDRIQKRLHLTKEGEHMYNKSVELLANIDTFQREMLDMGRTRNHVRIVTISPLEPVMLPTLIRDFQKEHPHILLDIAELGTAECKRRVKYGHADVAILITTRLKREDGEFFDLYTTDLMYCVEEGHPLADYEEVSFFDVAPYPLVLVGHGDTKTNAITTRMKDQGLTPKVSCFTRQNSTMRQFLSDKETGAFFLREVAQTMPGVRLIPLTHPLHKTDVGIMWNRNQKLYSDTIAFIKFAKNYQFNWADKKPE